MTVTVRPRNREDHSESSAKVPGSMTRSSDCHMDSTNPSPSSRSSTPTKLNRLSMVAATTMTASVRSTNQPMTTAGPRERPESNQ